MFNNTLLTIIEICNGFKLCNEKRKSIAVWYKLFLQTIRFEN